MERGGNKGSFHGYRRLPSQTTPSASSGMKMPEIGMSLSDHIDHSSSGSSSNNNTHSATDDTECIVREQDRFMPIANVIRIMRKILPPHAKISDDAKETIQECVSEYISFITGEANERCQHEQRKTITAEDVLWAMSKLGFDDYIEPLTLYLHRYREFDGSDRGSLRVESLVRRPVVVDPAAANSHGFPVIAPVFQMGRHHGYFQAAAMGGFLKEASSAGPSRSASAVANLEPHAQCKD